MSIGEILEIVEANGFNVTFSGGDPLYQAANLVPLARELTSRGYRIWCYTGFMYEEIISLNGVESLLPYIEVLVDGPFIMSQRDISLLFRGSRNQRLIDVGKSLSAGTIVLWDESETGW